MILQGNGNVVGIDRLLQQYGTVQGRQKLVGRNKRQHTDAYRRQDSQEEQIPYSVLSLSRFRSLPPFFSLALFFVCTGTNVIRNTSIFKKQTYKYNIKTH